MWEIALGLVASLVISMFLSNWQHRRYASAVNELVAKYRGQPYSLVSGRAKGRLRGGVAVLVVDREAQAIIEGLTMSGATVFKRPTPHEALAGPLDTLEERLADPIIVEACTQAMTMLPAIPRVKAKETSGKVSTNWKKKD